MYPGYPTPPPERVPTAPSVLPGAGSAPPHRWGAGAFAVVVVVYVGVSVLLAALFAGRGPLAVGQLIAAVALPTMSAAAVAVLITMVRGNGPVLDLRLRWSWRATGIGALIGLGGLLVTLPASVLYVFLAGGDATSAVGEVFAGVATTWPWAVAVLLTVVVVAPLCEEIVFRGLLWGAVERRWGRWAAFAITTVMFALAHLEPSRTPLLLIVAIPLGLARLLTGGLPASIVAHSINNLLPGIALMFLVVG